MSISFKGGVDHKWMAKQRRLLGKRVSRRTKYANRIHKELAPLATNPIDVVFESRLAVRENERNCFLITIFDYRSRSRTSSITLQVVVWERRDDSRPIGVYREEYNSWLDYVGHQEAAGLYHDTDADVERLIRDIQAIVKERDERAFA